MILMYHRLGKEQGFNTLPFSYFNEHVSFLQKAYQLISMDEYVKHVQNKTLQPNYISISFDDAYTTTIEHLLVQHRQLPAIVYVPVHFIGKHNLWDKGQPAYEIASHALLAQLIKSTHTRIGSHGLDHRHLSELNIIDLKNEVTQSKIQLEQSFDSPIYHFSYPFGQRKDLPLSILPMLKEAGYQSAVTTLYGNNSNPASPYLLQRIEVEPADTALKLKSKLQGWYFMYRSYKQRIKNLL